MLSAEAFGDPWRVACPRGHVNLGVSSASRTAYCHSCGRRYDWAELVDRLAEA